MAHYHERDRMHSAPRATPATGPPTARPTARSTARSSARIDCDSCPIAGTGCGDCMVALLGPVRFRLDDAEQRAVAALSDHGLISEREAGAAYATPDLPDWMTQSWPQQEDERTGATGGNRLRAIG